jgi:hypothetical protein
VTSHSGAPLLQPRHACGEEFRCCKLIRKATTESAARLPDDLRLKFSESRNEAGTIHALRSRGAPSVSAADHSEQLFRRTLRSGNPQHLLNIC